MSEQQIGQHVRAIARDTSHVFIGAHTKYVRMKQRDISREDICKCLQYGQMNRAPEPGKYVDELKCRFDYRDKDRKPFGVEVAVSDSDPNLIVITVVRYTWTRIR